MSFFFKQKNIRGFTIVELLVTLSIMMVILVTVSLNQNKYSAGISLKNLANSISLSIRQAQIYGISVREATPGSSNFTSGYGMVFSTVGVNNKQYIYFADKGTNNKYYDGPWTCPLGSPCDEFLQLIPVTNNNSINDLCVITIFNGSDTETCGLGRIDIVYVRPKIDTNFTFWDSSLNNVTYSGVKGAKIKLVSTNGESRSVTVYVTGQISVQ